MRTEGTEDRALIFSACEAGCHAGGTKGDKHAACHCGRGFIVKRAIAAVGGACDEGNAAVYGKCAVGVDAVACGIYQQVAARDDDLAALAGKGAHAGTSAHGGAVVAARRVETVVRRNEVDVDARNDELGGFDALVAFGDMNHTAADAKIGVSVNAVVARFYSKFATRDANGAVRMNGIIRRIDGKGAARDENVGGCFQSFGRFAVGSGRGRAAPHTPHGIEGAARLRRGVGASAACGEGEGAAHNIKEGLCLNTVVARGDAYSAAFDIDIAAACVLFVVRADAVGSRINGDVGIRDLDAILAGKSHVLRGDVQGAARDDKIVLGHDAVLVISFYCETSLTVDGHVLTGEKCRVKGGVLVHKLIGIAVGKKVLRAVGKRQENLVGAFDEEGGAVL